MTIIKHTTYLKSIISIFFLLILIVSLTNYTVDPAGIYHGQKNLKNIVLEIESSKNGLIFRGAWNERIIALSLAKFSAKTSCYVIGSSHVAAIGSARQQTSFTRDCPNLINLSVAGASLEDFIALSGVIIKNKNQPKTIVFGIDPWSLNFDRDRRWITYKDEYESFLQTITNTKDGYYKEYSLMKNLINFEYFIHSVNEINSIGKTIINAPEFDQAVGYDEAVQLRDGSFVYSKETIQKRRNKIVTGLHHYKIVDGVWYSESAVKTFKNLLQYLQLNYDVILVLAPYHPAIWKYDDQPIDTAMRIIEDKVHEIAESLSIKVVGSYNPKKVGCMEEDFIDDMHSSAICMMKLQR